MDRGRWFSGRLVEIWPFDRLGGKYCMDGTRVLYTWDQCLRFSPFSGLSEGKNAIYSFWLLTTVAAKLTMFQMGWFVLREEVDGLRQSRVKKLGLVPSLHIQSFQNRGYPFISTLFFWFWWMGQSFLYRTRTVLGLAQLALVSRDVGWVRCVVRQNRGFLCICWRFHCLWGISTSMVAFISIHQF
jgi:hypothetical protein